VVVVMASGQVVLAHYGGAPEAVSIVLPVVLFTGFLLLERRARRRERERAGLRGNRRPGREDDHG
jgi:hypothetical protein